MCAPEARSWLEARHEKHAGRDPPSPDLRSEVEPSPRFRVPALSIFSPTVPGCSLLHPLAITPALAGLLSCFLCTGHTAVVSPLLLRTILSKGAPQPATPLLSAQVVVPGQPPAGHNPGQDSSAAARRVPSWGQGPGPRRWRVRHGAAAIRPALRARGRKENRHET
jgi:hypothetical protein